MSDAATAAGRSLARAFGRVANVRVDEAPASLFVDVLKAVARYLDETSKPAFLESEHFRTYVQLEDYATKPVGFSDFRVFRVLGRGAFGAALRGGCGSSR